MSTSSLSPQTFGLPWPDLNDGLSYNDVVKPSDSELTLIEFYSSKYKSSAPLQGWLQRIRNGQITVDGEVVRDSNTILRVGSELVYHRLAWREPDAPYLLEVLYEDDDMIALNKPGGLQVLPGGLFQQRTVLTQLLWRQTQKIHHLACQESHPVPVHRLGRGTSGILLCAKTKHAKTQLAAYFADGTSHIGDDSDTNMKLHTIRKISKIYRALVTGILCEDEVIVKQPIGTVRYPGVAKGLYVASPTGKPALSKVEVLERDIQKNHTIVQVEIQSGRPHQIRIHLSFIGHPLLGDLLYVAGGQPKCLGSDFVDESFADDGGFKRPTKPVPGDCGYNLHAHQVVLSHPSSNEVIKITAPLPLVLRTREEIEELSSVM
ncbi:putative 23S rRNA pseudouridine(1911/1915/1917) synthase [Rosa chinensis]|uniref:Putative 23S rRNA pseudouridine(1911/1915/1917) synthase n=1 Tax=Rosa chinensis TaxID=74649 RepID=A0A2P6SJK6_ROSCH|nr:RNA pseudouridine synthase 5 isoform X1 [Rosa chinensis]PRQ58856.1 putative 23S rRNA pseudouridine(1911/1915/1917) synthase [Rosa chinensis]